MLKTPQICGDGAPSIRCHGLFGSRYFFHTLQSINSSPWATHTNRLNCAPLGIPHPHFYLRSLAAKIPTSLIEVPPDVAQLREEIFNISHGQPISIERARFQQFWPYLDNIYVSKGSRKSTRGPTVTYLYCRLFGDKDHKTLVAPGDRQRNRASRSAIGCPCRLKKVDNGSGPIQLI